MGRRFADELLPDSSPRSRENRDGLVFICSGPSMFPTFRTGERIFVRPYGSSSIRRGDIIVFRPPGSNRVIAHRAVMRRGGRLATRGDNNNLFDPWPISRVHVLGKATGRERRGRVSRLAGGPAGALRGGFLRASAMARLTVFRLLRPAYRWAAARGIFWRIVPFSLKTRVVAVERPDGKELQLVAGRTVIAKRPAGGGGWLIRRPFRLLIPPSRLP